MQPRKKPRLTPMGMPDGFEKTSAPSKAKVSVPRFTSAFALSESNSVAKPHSTKTPHSFLDPQLRNAGSSENAKSAARRGGTHAATSLASGACLNTHSDIASSRPDPFVAFKDFSHDKIVRPVQQDLLAFMPVNDASTSPDVLLRTLQAPQLASIMQGNEEQNAKPMKRMGSPPRLPPGDESKNMLTISTTSIARFTDIATEGGNAELASIFLYDQHPEMLEREESGEARRGLNFSPQKKRYGHHGPQFVRNGLASRASQVLGRMRTSLTLWQREMESQALPDTLSRLKPDLHMTIDKIELVPVPMTTKSSSSCFGIALCRIHALSSQIVSMNSRKLFKVVFSFPLPAPQGCVRNASRFAAKTEVYAWLPLHEVKLAPQATHLNAEKNIVSDPAGVQDHVTPIPASFPMPLTFIGDTSQTDLQLSDTALLCSRFLFLPPRGSS